MKQWQIHVRTLYFSERPRCSGWNLLQAIGRIFRCNSQTGLKLKDKPKDQIKIIDVAAGTGLIGAELQKLGYTSLHALDISQEMLNEAKKKNVYKKLICAALNDLRIPEIETGEFDGLVCGGTILTGHIRSSALVEMIGIVKIVSFAPIILCSCTRTD